MRCSTILALVVLMAGTPTGCGDDDLLCCGEEVQSSPSSSSTGSSGGSGSSGSSQTSTSTSKTAQACRDTAAAVAGAAQRCGENYQANYNSFVQVAAEGNCDNIKVIRDSSSLYGVCIPSLGKVSCADLYARKLDPSCYDQLQ